MRIYPFFLILLISSCGKIPAPSLISPSESNNIQSVSFGDQPTNYQNILKKYLIENLKNYKTAKVEFINIPSKLSIDHLGSTYTGYRVCLSINEKREGYYIGNRNHFFIINNNEVNLHLFDSGLLTIPFEYCVTRNISNQMYVDDIPEKIDAISVDSMDSIELSTNNNASYIKLQNELDKLKQENQELKKLDKSQFKENSIEDLAKIETTKEVYNIGGNIYISCDFDDKSMTYIFNAKEETFKFINKLDIVKYTVSFNDAYIVATNEALELTINRITGEAALEDKTLNKGLCNLTNKTKF